MFCQPYVVAERAAWMLSMAGNMLTESDFLGKTIDVKGIVDYFSGSHQIKVFTSSDIVIK